MQKSRFMCFESSAKFFVLVLLLFSFDLCIIVDAIRCYCTDKDCAPYGVCEADVCLVGLLKSNNAVVRTCGNEPVGCMHNVGKWSDLCACEENFCNTFSFLRANTNGNHGGHTRDGSYGDGDLVFHRVDSPLGDFSHMFDDSMQDESTFASKTSLLTLLLVIVPLSVGAATVLVVASNYYCHLC